jgi:hypothetical protein
MPAPNDLTNKIKEGLIKSGFPLEMKIGSTLDKNQWANSIGSLYKDFETDKMREIDLSADKSLNGFAVHLNIACKKSTEKQIILYSPQANRLRHPFFDMYLKAFPSLNWSEEKKKGYSSKRIFSAFQDLHFFNSIPLSNKLIISKGNVITEDNIKFLSDFNGLVKNSIISGSDGYIDTSFRIIYLYVLVFDGHIFNLSRSGNEDFDLQETEYGKLLYEPILKFSGNDHNSIPEDLSETAVKFGSRYVIEVMTPSYFEKYLQNVETTFNKMDKSLLSNWGIDWDEFKEKFKIKAVKVPDSK